MTPDLGHPVQIAYAVAPDRDLNVVASDFRRRTGAGPFIVASHIGLRSSIVNGVATPFDHSSAYGQWGDVMVELLQEHTPPIVTTTGVHHMAFMVVTLDRAIETCARHGWDVVLDAETKGGQRFVFCDARPDLGHLVELYEPTPALLAFYEHIRSIRA